MYRKRQIGSWGEEVASNFLMQNGYEIVKRNFVCKQGEIDIIAKNEEYIVFVEVKTRSYTFFGNPVEAVNEHKQKNISKAAKYYLYKNWLQDCFVRFDVIYIYIMKNGYKVNHIKQIM